MAGATDQQGHQSRHPLPGVITLNSFHNHIHYIEQHADDYPYHHHHGPDGDFLVCSQQHDDNEYLVLRHGSKPWDEYQLVYGPADHDH